MKEVIGHVIGGERMFANASERTMGELVDEFRAVRLASLALFRGLSEPMWSRRAIGSGCEFTVRALAYIIVGHELHHRSVIEQRYLRN